MAGPLSRHGLTVCEQTELLNQVLDDNSIVENTSDEDKIQRTHKISNRKMATGSQKDHSVTFPQGSRSEDMTVDEIYEVLHCFC
jgi:hypothetical protein